MEEVVFEGVTKDGTDEVRVRLDSTDVTPGTFFVGIWYLNCGGALGVRGAGSIHVVDISGDTSKLSSDMKDMDGPCDPDLVKREPEPMISSVDRLVRDMDEVVLVYDVER